MARVLQDFTTIDPNSMHEAHVTLMWREQATQTGRFAGGSVEPGPTSDGEWLREFLKNEVGALDLYRIGIQQLELQEHPNNDELSLLRQIRTHHAEQAQVIRERLCDMEDGLSDSAGGWIVWDRAMMSTASHYGGPAMLRALKECEEQWLAEYRRSLDKAGAGVSELLWRHLIPAVQHHVDLLDDLLADRSPLA